MAKQKTGGKGGKGGAGKPRANPKTKGDVPGAAGVASAGHNSKGSKLTPDEERQLFLRHRTTWNEYQAKLKVVEKIGIDVKAALKADGFKVGQMVIADQLTTVKGEAKVVGEVSDRLKVARWIGHAMGNQLDLFEQPDRTPSVDRAFDEGKQSSMENKPRKSPYAAELEQSRTWYAGYDKHQETLQGGVGRGNGDAPTDPKDATGADKVHPSEATSGVGVSRSEFKRRLQEQTQADETGAPAVKH